MLRKLYLKHSSLLMRELQWMSRGQRLNYSLLKSVARLESDCPQNKSSIFTAAPSFAQSPSFSSKAAFEEVCNETLESLTECFEELVETVDHLEGADVNYSDGVLTVQFGEPYGTYVINRQSPNKQIWFSSPTSGPKRYDYIAGRWIYHHDGVSLHELLNNEIAKILKTEVDFKRCSHSQPSEK